MLCILTEILSRVHVKGAKSHNGFKFGTFIGRFPSDSAANMAVKRLKKTILSVHIIAIDRTALNG